MHEEELEKIFDDVKKTLEETKRRIAVRDGIMDPSIFTRQDLGIKRLEQIYTGRDGGYGEDIQRGINRASDYHTSQRENRVNKFLSKIASEGLYGYLKLRKILGYTKESFKVRPWYAQKLDASMALINPGGQVNLSDGTFDISTKLSIAQKIGLLGMGPQTTILKPTADIHMIEIKPSITMGEAGIGVIVDNLKIYDEDAETSTKAAIVLDGTDKHISNVLLTKLLIEDYYDGIINIPKTGGDPWSQDLWNWHNTIRDLTIKGFKHHAIYWQNVADTIHSNIWLLSTTSSVAAVLMEKHAQGSLKMGGNMFHNFRIFNENLVDTAHGIWMKDYGEAWFNNVIVESVGISFYLQGCFNLFMSQTWGVGYPPSGMLKEGFRLDPVEESRFVGCHAHDNGLEGFNLRGKTRNNSFIACTAKNNSRVGGQNKHGFILWGLSAEDSCINNRLISCKSYDDQDTPTQYGGIGERSLYTDYNAVIAPVTFGNTNVSVNLEGLHSVVAWSNELQPDKPQYGANTTDAAGDRTVTFPNAFAAIPFILIQSKDASGRGVVFDVTAVSTTQFTVKARKVTSIPINTSVSVDTQGGTGQSASKETVLKNATCPGGSVTSKYVVTQVCDGGVPTCPETKDYVASNIHGHVIVLEYEDVSADYHTHATSGIGSGSGSGSANAPGVAADFTWYAIPQQPQK